MTAKEFHFYFSWCINNGITIYPKPTTVPGIYKIIVNNRGNEKIGEGIYRNKALQNELNVWDKINSLYVEIYNRNNKPKAA